MPICVLKRGDLCVFTENEARFLHQNEVNFARQRNKMAANLDLLHMHLHRQPNANTKLDLWSPIVDRKNCSKYNIISNFIGKHGNNISVSNKTEFDYRLFSLLNFLGAAMLDFMTSYDCPIEPLPTSFPGSSLFLPRGRKREDPGNEVEPLLTDNYGNRMTSQNPKWRRAGNLNAKIGDNF